MKRKFNWYIITYLIWFLLLLTIILCSKTETGAPYPIGAGIFVSLVSSVAFSIPVWIIMLFLSHFSKSKIFSTVKLLTHKKSYIENSVSKNDRNLSHPEEKLLLYAMDAACKQGWISTTFLQRVFYLKYEDAAKLIDTLELCGWIEPWNNITKSKRRLLITSESWSKLRSQYIQPEHISEVTMSSIDAMDGHTFESYCADLLQRNGFYNVSVTQASGDFGIDVLAEKDNVTYAIQCKCYSGSVGNHAVQEAFSGARYYHRMVAVVMTNSRFTHAAVETAKQINVLLWDRDKILEMERTSK